MLNYIMAAVLLNGISSIAMAQNTDEQSSTKSASKSEKIFPSPNAIIDAAPASEWIMIAPSDLLVMDLAPDRDGNKRRVIIQLMPEPFSQGWIRNIRKLTAAKFWDDTAIIRVQDNYVTQWGDSNADKETAKTLPDGLEVMSENDYETSLYGQGAALAASGVARPETFLKDNYTKGETHFLSGWPIAISHDEKAWPVHCYAMVGVGRDLSPNTGDGSSLYTVIGHAPRHLDRNIALVGRVISGMEHMSSLARGTGDLGFYETPEERTQISSVRMGNELSDTPTFEYLSTEDATFAKYADARANRRDPFFNIPAGGVDVCNVPVPIREKNLENDKAE